MSILDVLTWIAIAAAIALDAYALVLGRRTSRRLEQVRALNRRTQLILDLHKDKDHP